MTPVTHPRVWLLFHADNRTAQAWEDPGLELEGFSTITAAGAEVAHRFDTGRGTAHYVHPDRRREVGGPLYWPGHVGEDAFALVWLASAGQVGEPDATSAPDETWRPTGRGGVRRTRWTGSS